MLRFVVRRLLLLIPILIGLSILVFLWIRALPGSPATTLLGERATQEQIEAINEQYGLNDPLPVQYLRYVRTTIRGDFGDSVTSRRPVVEEFQERFPATLELAFAAMLFSVVLGVPLGFIAAKRHGSWIDHTSLLASLIGISIPIFFLAIILKYIFAVQLGWLPTVGPDLGAHRPRAPDELLRPRRDHRRRPGGALGRAQAPRAAGDRPRDDPARDHRAHHASRRARRPERGLRAHGAREGRVAANRRPAATCCGTRCCRS